MAEIELQERSRMLQEGGRKVSSCNSGIERLVVDGGALREIPILVDTE